MKTSPIKNTFLSLAIVAAVGLTGCSAVTNDVESLTEQDLEMAAQIAASSLSDSESGVTSSLYDAFAVMSNAGLPFSTTLAKHNRDNHRQESGRGRESNFSYSYDPETGTHTRTFSRNVETPAFSKSVDVTQQMIFTDISENFLQFPRAQKDSIETISFIGNKSGSSDGPVRSANFTKIDTMLIGGIHTSNNFLTINGNHHGFGNSELVLRDSSQLSRQFDIAITFENVTINKDTVEAYGNLEQGVSGTLSYSMVINRTRNGNASEDVVEGTIDLTADGSALLRFDKFDRIFRLSLIDGDYLDVTPGRGNSANRPL